MDIVIPEGMSDAALLALIVGFFQPVVLDFIIQSKWSKRVQALVAFLFSIVVGIVVALVSGVLTGLGVVSAILLVAAVSITFYKGFWKETLPGLKSGTDIPSS